MPKPAELQLTPGKPMRWMMARSFLRREEVKGALFFFSHISSPSKRSLFFRQITLFSTIDEKSEQMLYITEK